MQFIRVFVIPLIILLVMVDMIFFRFLLKISRGIGIAAYFWIVVIAIEYYAFQAFRALNHSKTGLWTYIIVHVLLFGGLYYFSSTRKLSEFNYANFQRFVVLTTLFLVPKIFLTLTLMVDDFVRLFQYSFTSAETSDAIDVPSRRKVATWIGLGLAAIPFIGVLDGVFRGKYRYRVIRKTIYFDDLPEAFEGFTITQLSDIHAGSFDDKEKLDYGVKLALKQNSDVLVFTGDMVNDIADELEPYVDIFKQLEAKDGMFAILGNHDYGEYANISDRERAESVAHLQNMHKEIGFKMLNNAMHTIERDGQRLNILGVENWGHADFFPKRGDLRKASDGVQEGDFNVLLSHDPSHFDHDLKDHDNVIDFEKKMHLTLSGHTHGMQFGIEIPGFIKWSPVKYRYHNWAGLYEEKGRKLYVNRGFGFLGFPGRIGMWPEITVLELRKKV